MSNIFNLNWHDVLSAVVSGVLAAVVGYLSNATNIMAVSPEAVLNVAVIAALASLLKALSKDSDGKILGKF